MNWPTPGQWEAAIGEVIVLPLLFFELYCLRRSQRRDREKARDDAATAGEGPPVAEVRRTPSSPPSRRSSKIEDGASIGW